MLKSFRAIIRCMSTEVVLDIETKDTFQEVGSREPAKLSMSIAIVYLYADNTFRVFTEEQLPQLWPILEHASRIIGYNHRHFDMPVLNRYYRGDCMKFPLLDMMEEAQKVLGYRPSLNDIAKGTLGVEKSGHGLDAIRYWKEGDMTSLTKYCKDDVQITRDVYEYGKKNGKLLCKERFGESRVIPVDFIAKEAKAALNLTLGL